MNILVTGGAGFTGSRYVRTLLAPDETPDGPGAPRVTVLDALTCAGTAASLPLGHPRLDFVHGDVRDAAVSPSMPRRSASVPKPGPAVVPMTTPSEGPRPAGDGPLGPSSSSFLRSGARGNGSRGTGPPG